MAINNINGTQGSQPPRTGEGGKVQSGRSAPANPLAGDRVSSRDDSVSLTDTAAHLRSLEASLAEQPEIDEGRVADIQRAIADGSYQVNAGKIADKLLDFEAAFGR